MKNKRGVEEREGTVIDRQSGRIKSTQRGPSIRVSRFPRLCRKINTVPQGNSYLASLSQRLCLITVAEKRKRTTEMYAKTVKLPGQTIASMLFHPIWMSNRLQEPTRTIVRPLLIERGVFHAIKNTKYIIVKRPDIIYIQTE